MKATRMPTSPLDLALRYGMLTPVQVEIWRRTGNTREGEALIDDLVELGYLDADEGGILRSLLKDPEASAAEPPSITPTVVQLRTGTTAPLAADATRQADLYRADSPATIGSCATVPMLLPRPFGKYQLVAELGRGGMGVVYKAWHPALKTHFAIKVLLAGAFSSHEEEERFRREAQLSARIKHPGIVGVYDIGIEEDRSYFAMEFVNGVSLNQVLTDPARYGLARAPGAMPSLLPMIAIGMTQEIASAVQVAHEAGVIHRDLKPANVLRQQDGRLKVADFGLARSSDPGRVGATVTGALLGTPEYMSPEQAEGRVRDVDSRSDVYQLGAILYELMTGVPPHGGSSVMKILEEVCREDPRPPHLRNPRIDRDAETICLKALARDPGRRYASARALAEDCGRYLAGESILARPEIRWERWLRRVRRHKALSALSATGIVLLAASGFLTWERAVARRETAAAQAAQEQLRRQTLDALRRDAATQVDATLFVRRAGIAVASAGERFLPQLEAAAHEVMAQAPDLAEPHYHLGRMRRALMQWDAALEAQEAALRSEPDFAPSLYERSILRARLFRDRMQKLRDDWARAEGLRLKAGGADPHSQPPDEELVRRDPETQRMRDALAVDLARLDRLARSNTPPAPHAPTLIVAMLDCAEGIRLAYGPRDDEKFARARIALERAIAADPTLEEAHEALAWLATTVGDHPRAIEIYTSALAADQGYVPHWIERGRNRSFLARDLDRRGESPTETFTQAEADLTRALELDPKSQEALILRGQLFSTRGLLASERGEDPIASYRSGEQDLDRAIAADPECCDAVRTRGTLRTNWGKHEQLHGIDPSPRYQSAEEDLSRAVQLAPESAVVRVNRTTLRTNWGGWRRSHGEDPTEQFRGAEEDLNQALEINPNWDRMWAGRGEVRLSLALLAKSHGKDPNELFHSAAADFGRALELNPGVGETWMRRGIVRLNFGNFLTRQGESAELSYRDAEADLGKALELIPGTAAAWYTRGIVRAFLAGGRGEAGNDPDALFAGAEEDLAKALALNAGYADAWRWRGLVRARRASAFDLVGKEFAPLRRDAEADLGKALALNPADANAWAARGDLRADVGLSAWSRGTDPAEPLRLAEEDYAKAIERNPASTEAWIGRGNVRTWGGLWKQARGEDPASEWEGALADFTHALSLNPRDAEPWRRRARIHEAQGARPEAQTDLDEAIVLNPKLKDRLRETIAELQSGNAAAHLERACALAVAAEKATALEDRADLRERAFGRLRSAVQTGGLESSAWESEARLQGLRGDPRWTGLSLKPK